MIGPESELAAQFVIEVAVRDIQRSVAFYTALGFSLSRRTSGFAVLQWHDQLLFLDEQKDLAPSDSVRANLRILVDDVDAIWGLAQRLQLRIHQTIGNRYYGLRDFTILDPDGFGLRFAARLTT